MTILNEIKLANKKLEEAYLLFDNALSDSEIDESIQNINELTNYLNDLYKKVKLEQTDFLSFRKIKYSYKH